MNDKQATVTVLIDHLMEHPKHSPETQGLLFHPLSNEYTVMLSFPELEKFVKSTNHEMTLLNLAEI